MLYYKYWARLSWISSNFTKIIIIIQRFSISCCVKPYTKIIGRFCTRLCWRTIFCYSIMEKEHIPFLKFTIINLLCCWQTMTLKPLPFFDANKCSVSVATFSCWDFITDIQFVLPVQLYCCEYLVCDDFKKWCNMMVEKSKNIASDKVNMGCNSLQNCICVMLSNQEVEWSEVLHGECGNRKRTLCQLS